MSEITEAANIGYARAVAEPINEPKISYRNIFYFPEGVSHCTVSDLYGEITLPVSSSESQILTASGKIRDTVSISRSSDNFIFSSKPDSISESRILDAVEDSQYPYLVRVRNIEDSIKVKLVLSTDFGAITNNVIEFIPAPYIGGTMFEYITFQDTNNVVTNPTDINGVEIKTLDVPKNLRFRPIRFYITESDRKAISFGYEGISKLEGSNISLAGLYKLRVERRVWEPKAFIGFKISSEVGRSLVSITPSLKWCNTYTGSMRFRVYNNYDNFIHMGPDSMSVFNETGIGTPVSMDEDLWVMLEIQSKLNGTPQIAGFNYESAVV